MAKTVKSLVMEFDQTKYEEFLSSGSKSSRVAQQYRRVSSEVRSQVLSETSPKIADANSTISGHVRAWPASTSSMRPTRPTLLKAKLAMLRLFLSSRLPGVPSDPWCVTGMLNIDKGVTYDDNRYKKLEKSSVQRYKTRGSCLHLFWTASDARSLRLDTKM